MNSNYFVIDAKVLPDYFEKVLKAKEMVAQGISVQEACRTLDISRSTYYKYKDSVFSYNTDSRLTQKAIIALLLKHQTGVMLELYTTLANANVNIMSLTQSMIVNNNASVEIAMDLGNTNCTINELTKTLEKLNGVIKVELLAIESV